MKSAPRIGVASLAVLAVLGCGSAPAPTVTATVRPASVPSASATPSPAGPFAVVVTNAQRTGTTYDVLLIDTGGHIVQQVTAQLPHEKPNQTLDLPLVSASGAAVYYLDGDTDIRSLNAGGQQGVVKTIAAGSTSEIGFAVSADGARIAVTVVNEKADEDDATGIGYVEDLTDTANHVQLWSNTGDDAARWPVGWSGDSIIDAVGYFTSGGCYGGPPCTVTAQSYHVIAASNGQRTATICETPSAPGVYYQDLGTPAANGLPCVEEVENGSQSTTGTLYVVDWSGTQHRVLSATGQSGGYPLSVGDCYLSPDGSRLLCESSTNQSAEIVTSGGQVTDLGRRYNLLGWIDPTHFLVEIDAAHLGVLQPDSGALISIPTTGADQMSLAATLPNPL